jgi:hypothetical protein
LIILAWIRISIGSGGFSKIPGSGFSENGSKSLTNINYTAEDRHATYVQTGVRNA